jgi:hypothetical protein
MNRPLVNKNIDELERLFGEWRDSPDRLRTLLEELTLRKRKRAAALRAKVEAELKTGDTPPRPTGGGEQGKLPIGDTAKAAPRKIGRTPKVQNPPADQAPRGSRTGGDRHVETPAVPLGSSSAKTRFCPPPPAASPAPSYTASTPSRPVPLPRLQMPTTDNSPEGILSAWTALEVLSPPTFRRPEDLAGGDRRAVASLTGQFLPWEGTGGGRPNYKLYYQIVLGSIRLEPAVEKLVERFGDTRAERPGARGQAPLAVVVVDRNGRLAASPSVAVSSFAWGVTTALKEDLVDLAAWPQVEQDLVERLERRFRPPKDEDEDADDEPLDHGILRLAYEHLVANLGLPPEWIECPRFAIRVYEYYKSSNPPEPLLLNSFFLPDLALARQLFSAGKPTDNLRRYLQQVKPNRKGDLLQDRTALEDAVAPDLTPAARWPGAGRHPLVLLQQAAVNIVFEETKRTGLVAVNGPPGTGKTTLLRDIVAGVVAERAEAMARFNDPEMAFQHSGLKLKAGNAWLHLYRVDPALRGFEMVVASSNNKAVENVSAELPGLSAIADDAPALRYFSTLSDALHERETWGLIAAVLGNAQNRSRFKKTFWWNCDFGLSLYLAAAAGSPIPIQAADSATDRIEQRPPLIVTREKPPSGHQEALQRWQQARMHFLSVLQASRDRLSYMATIRGLTKHLPVLTEAEQKAIRQHERALADESQSQRLVDDAIRTNNEAQTSLARIEQRCASHDSQKPGFFAQLFGSGEAVHWQTIQAGLLSERNQARTRYAETKKQLGNASEQLRKATATHQLASFNKDTAAEALSDAQQKISVAMSQPDGPMVDSTFFEQSYAAKHQATPWLGNSAQISRDEVFIAAMALHRAFIDAAAKPIRHNLGAFMNVLSGQSLAGADKQALLPHLWTTLFLVVPLVSTTFASVGRMLGKLPSESLGWLLVDEAGQALPQAAVGAILRTQRAVVVGDPAQIEPVVVLPDMLAQSVCRRFRVDPDQFAAPVASVQTLADAASPYVTEFQAKTGSRTVGVPLLVHRRCADPMFSISNAIAYSGLMVQAKVPKPSAIRNVLGPSSWIHVEGTGDDKWCAREGEEVLRLLGELARANAPPDLYIITPFVIVSQRLQQLVRDSGVLKDWIPEGDLWSWTSERIGTVHTAQGREADAVILILGAPLPAQTGARNWAGGRPNILNVAVTRAKEVIYVIGNRRLWREAGFFKDLDAYLSPFSEHAGSFLGGRVWSAVEAVALEGQPMNVRKTIGCPAEIEATRRRFERWRHEIRKSDTHISQTGPRPWDGEWKRTGIW